MKRINLYEFMNLDEELNSIINLPDTGTISNEGWNLFLNIYKIKSILQDSSFGLRAAMVSLKELDKEIREALPEEINDFFSEENKNKPILSYKLYAIREKAKNLKRF